MSVIDNCILTGLAILHLRSGQPLRIGDDSKHWVTTEGGSHLLIDGAGKVVAGAGGKLNGMTKADIKHRKSTPQETSNPKNRTVGTKSKDVSSHTDLTQRIAQEGQKQHGNELNQYLRLGAVGKSSSYFARQYERTGEIPKGLEGAFPESKPKPKHEELKERLSSFFENNKGLNSIQLKTKLNALTDEINLYQKSKDYDRESFSEIYTKWHETNNKIKELKKQENKQAGIEKRKATAAAKKSGAITTETKYSNHTPEQINQEFKDKYGLGFLNSSARTIQNKLDKNWKDLRENKISEEQYESNRQELKNLKASLSDNERVIDNVSGHTPHDLTGSTPAAKKSRAMIAKISETLDSIPNIKSILEKGNVAYTPGTTGKAGGHAFQAGGVGFFTIHADKYTPEFNAEQQRIEDLRKQNGKPKWNATIGLKGVVIHELTHSLGMQPHIDSPNRLKGILQTVLAGKTPEERHKWICDNISEYATKNIKETDAELCSLVMDDNYIKGTLPKELEDHVAWLWG